jgi:uncharacterized membrane protein
MKKLLLLMLLLQFLSLSGFSQHLLKGTVIAEDSLKVPGATIRIKDAPMTVSTDADGAFQISLPTGKYMLSVHYMGYKDKEVNIELPMNQALRIHLEAEAQSLEEVNVSTGYQILPKCFLTR